MPTVEETFDTLARLFRTPCVAEIGGFRPPEDPTASWFGRGVCLPEEKIPTFQGQPLFPLLQIRCSDLIDPPASLAGIVLLVVYMNHAKIPFGLPHGEGWMVREYSSTEGLRPYAGKAPPRLKPFPTRWRRGTPEPPGWDESWGLTDMSAINESEEAPSRFFALPHHSRTKVGGYPTEIQHGVVNSKDYVFQIGSEEKPNWMWADNGVATFARNGAGLWSFECQFY